MLLAGAREVVEETYLDHNGTPPPEFHITCPRSRLLSCLHGR